MEPPDPIPNSVVKRVIADGSVGFPHVRVGHCQAPNKQTTPVANAAGVFCFWSKESLFRPARHVTKSSGTILNSFSWPRRGEGRDSPNTTHALKVRRGGAESVAKRLQTPFVTYCRSFVAHKVIAHSVTGSQPTAKADDRINPVTGTPLDKPGTSP